MPKDVVIRQGESVALLAERYGFSAHTIWDHPANAELRALREHMNVLMPGDIVHVPDRNPHAVDVETDRCHVFRLRGVPSLFRVQLFHNGAARSDTAFVLEVGGDVFEGRTDGKGVLEAPVSGRARSGVLTLADDEQPIRLRFGALDPSCELSGVKKRLHNLGFLDDPTVAPGGRRLSDALLDFQARYALDPTGEADDLTRARLREVHDTVNDNLGQPEEEPDGSAR